jgi:hypothetical protein
VLAVDVDLHGVQSSANGTTVITISNKLRSWIGGTVEFESRQPITCGSGCVGQQRSSSIVS